MARKKSDTQTVTAQIESLTPSKEELDTFYQQALETSHVTNLSDSLVPNEPSFKVKMDTALSLIKQKKEETLILDLGCGIGLYDFYILNKIPNANILGIDLSLGHIKTALDLTKKSDPKRVAFKVLDLDKLEEKDLGGFNKPNYIILTEVLEYLPDPRPVLKKIKSLCGPKTRLIFSASLSHTSENSTWYVQKKEQEYIKTLHKGELDQTQPIYRMWHKQYGLSELKRLLEEEGFAVKKIRGCLFRPFTPNSYFHSAMNRLTSQSRIDKFFNNVTDNKYARTVFLKCSPK